MLLSLENRFLKHYISYFKSVWITLYFRDFQGCRNVSVSVWWPFAFGSNQEATKEGKSQRIITSSKFDLGNISHGDLPVL